MTSNEGDGTPDPARGLDRRGFLIGAGAAGGAAAFDAAAYAAKQSVAGKAFPQAISVAQQVAAYALQSKPSFTVLLRRREDFLFLRVDGYNLVRSGQHLKRQVAGHDAFLVFEHLPQALMEQAYFDPPKAPSKPPPGAPGTANARLAYPTRLAFRIPSKLHAIPYTVAGLLNWQAFEPSLAPVADYSPLRAIHVRAAKKPSAPSSKQPSTSPVSKKPAPTKVLQKLPKIRRPTATETAIELPWRLALSPLSGGRWSHPVTPRVLGGWTELWHTRLAGSPDPLALDGAPFRAIWNYDVHNGKPTLDAKKPPAEPATGTDPNPFLNSLTPNDRYQIVRASSDFSITGRLDVQASKLWLSSRGGFLDSRGVWQDLPHTPRLTLDLVEWKHQATLGRDHYVKVVKKGFLFPFGHRVVETTVTERRFEKVGSEIVATSRQFVYLVVRQTDVSYVDGQTFGISNNSRDLPFRNLHFKTLRTPHLDPLPKFASAGPHPPNKAYLVSVSSAPFQWHIIGTDWAGRQIEFTAPAIFVSEADGYDAPVAQQIRDTYSAITDGVTNVGRLQGQTVAFAPVHKQGDTDLTTQTITFGARAGAGTPAQYTALDQAMTFPFLAKASVRLSAAEQASGGVPLDKSPEVKFHDTYVASEFDDGANKGRVFMEVLDASQPKVNFGGGSSGGVMTPNLKVTGLSRSLGPIAGPPGQIASGLFNPADIFKDVEAKILGGVNLIDILIPSTPFSGDVPSDKTLKITYDTSGSTLTTHLTWTPDVQGNEIIEKRDGFSFELDGLITTDVLHPENSTFSVDGHLKGFAVNLIGSGATGFIVIPVNALTFSAAKGQKSKVHVDLGEVKFVGVLEFVQKLEELMDFSGDGGPKIEVLPTGINADLSVPIPDIAVGVLALTNISLNAGFNLPFDGSPARFRFSFSTRDNEFGLSVAIFGGGGFFGIAIGTDGVELIEASLEFGAMCAINLGVASGSVHLLAGIYFSYGKNDADVETVVLSGFVKLGGQLSILGIIQLSLEFDMSLTYMGPPGSVTGTATLSVSVSVLFFSFSVSVTATKTFGGSGGSDGTSVFVPTRGPVGHLGPPPPPPTFVDQVPPDTPGGSTSTAWNLYCDAFAGN